MLGFSSKMCSSVLVRLPTRSPFGEIERTRFGREDFWWMSSRPELHQDRILPESEGESWSTKDNQASGKTAHFRSHAGTNTGVVFAHALVPSSAA